MVSWLPSSTCQENSLFQICPESQQGALSRVALASPLLPKAPFAEARTHHLFQEPTPGKAVACKPLSVNPMLRVFFLSLDPSGSDFMAQRLRQGNPPHCRGQVCHLSPDFYCVASSAQKCSLLHLQNRSPELLGLRREHVQMEDQGQL